MSLNGNGVVTITVSPRGQGPSAGSPAVSEIPGVNEEEALHTQAIASLEDQSLGDTEGSCCGRCLMGCGTCCGCECESLLRYTKDGIKLAFVVSRVLELPYNPECICIDWTSPNNVLIALGPPGSSAHDARLRYAAEHFSVRYLYRLCISREGGLCQ